MAAFFKHSEIFDLLIAHQDIDLDALDAEGHTALEVKDNPSLQNHTSKQQIVMQQLQLLELVKQEVESDDRKIPRPEAIPKFMRTPAQFELERMLMVIGRRNRKNALKNPTPKFFRKEKSKPSIRKR